jgi:hypothetical protein
MALPFPAGFVVAMGNALDGMGDLFLGRSFLLQVFLFGTIFYLVVGVRHVGSG